MEQNNTDTIPDTPAPLPTVRAAEVADIKAAFVAGWSDFRRAPLFGLFFGAFFACGGFAVFWILLQLRQPWWIAPFAVGFPLLGPFAAVGIYDVSRRLNGPEPLKWGSVLSAVFAERKRQLPSMAFIVLLVFWSWIYQVRTLTALFAGLSPFSTLDSFVDFITGSVNGIAYLAVGSVVGAIMALALYTVTVIAIPLLLDKELDFMSAIITSIKTVFASPVVMLGWGVVITLLALIGIATACLGLIVIFPVLGHTTWHLYTRLVVHAQA
ncbi:MAG: DUF2189 domain-containing protein [Sphingomonadales bacterium]